jgi:branched-chain amino acid transport system substrate-binding protein
LTGTFKIVSSLSRGGLAKAQTDMVIRAYEMALEDHHRRVGNATVSLEDLSNSNGARGTPDAPSEAANANQAINDPNALVYLGPSLSGLARVSIPMLCPSQLAMISYAATYPGLTKQTAYNAPGEPEMYYTDCQRNFTRVVPTDELQGAAAAAFAKQLGVTRVYALDDGTVYGLNLAATFASTATRLGLQVVGGPEAIDPAASDYYVLADKVQVSNPGLVYFGGTEGQHADKLWQDLRAVLSSDVKLMGADGLG